jgi:heat-inducible transcriptional repressor
MAFENLSQREKQILLNLITHYIKSADPVGSRVIANRFRMGISSATVRNTLADLEELGLVEQPHTSAGRIPTDLGYRVYVDYLVKPEELTEAEKDYIKGAILREGRGVKEILGQTSRVLGEITRVLGVSIAPQFDKGHLKRVELIPVADGRIMVVVVVQSGLARSVIVEIEANIDDDSLRQVEQVLNERLSGLSLGEIRRSVSERLSDVEGKGRLIKLLIDARDRIWSDRHGRDLKVAGLDQLMLQPEFASLERVSELVRWLEQGDILTDFLSHADSEGLVITIGKENQYNEIMNCSLVTSSYRVGNISGTIGIIGPTRMPYNKLASVVDYTARAISEVLSGLDQRKEA